MLCMPLKVKIHQKPTAMRIKTPPGKRIEDDEKGKELASIERENVAAVQGKGYNPYSPDWSENHES
jgi:hypothetical protein